MSSVENNGRWEDYLTKAVTRVLKWNYITPLSVSFDKANCKICTWYKQVGMTAISDCETLSANDLPLGHGGPEELHSF